ncbi:MFS transporter [Paenisporosarcina cavernae]|uniref:MFS transporter n=1 Tax=Paenisporosarcina cavernae TaxID=2320858 RepID=A0A385YTC5_9BACL|nr:MFS transporter [Paenisporosarcina cavernae]AYC30079.1 MFS transporter [Paenisporosarcina cavernae]
MEKRNWRVLTVYLSAVGIANIGSWIYLLTMNLLVFERTGSALAVAGLYMIKPLAYMVVGSWAGSVIDRVSTKHLMIFLDIVRAILVLTLLFVDSLWLVYMVVFIIQMSGAVFEHASFSYMTRLLPEQIRLKFNALLSFVQSGAFVLGPALAGFLFILGSWKMSLLVNIGTYIVSACLVSVLPKLTVAEPTSTRFNLQEVISDWRLVWNFSKVAMPFVVIYMVFQCVMLLTAALDSMEVAFAKEVLHLSDAAYGSLVSVAGIGFLMGAALTNGLVRMVTAKQLMSIGTLCLAMGYLIYSFSTTYVVASIGFFVLCFFLSLANTGFLTYIQTYIPIDMMGRISSLYGMVSHTVQLLVVFTMGIVADWFSIREVVIVGSGLMFVVASYLAVTVCRSTFQSMENQAVGNE